MGKRGISKSAANKGRVADKIGLKAFVRADVIGEGTRTKRLYDSIVEEINKEAGGGIGSKIKPLTILRQRPEVLKLN